MKCPGCGQDVKLVTRYVKPEHWYGLTRAAAYCPACNAQIILVWTKRFRTFYQLAIWTLWPGIMLLLVGGISHFYLLYRPAEVLMGVGTVFWLLALTRREYGVAPNSAATARKSSG